MCALLRRPLAAILLLGSIGSAAAQHSHPTSETTMHASAHGTFDVKMAPLSPSPGEGLSRMSLEKTYHGELDASASGEMISAGDPKQGAAGYVAMERISGQLAGRKGSFALQQSATMDAAGHSMTVLVVSGSGTGELSGISGMLTITIADGKHSYDLEYTLPEPR